MTEITTRQPLRNDRRDEHGPFDIIGCVGHRGRASDVHGCFDELVLLLARLGYDIDYNEEVDNLRAKPPPGRTAIFLGDLVDRGSRHLRRYIVAPRYPRCSNW